MRRENRSELVRNKQIQNMTDNILNIWKFVSIHRLSIPEQVYSECECCLEWYMRSVKLILYSCPHVRENRNVSITYKKVGIVNVIC